MSVSVARDVTAAVKPPRALFAPFLMGHVFGPAEHAPLQRRMIERALSLLTTAEVSGTIEEFGMTWADARKEKIAADRA